MIELKNMYKINAFLFFIVISPCVTAQPNLNVVLNSRLGVSAPLIAHDQRDIYTGDDTRSKPQSNIVTEKVTAFSPFFDDALIDSFWQEFRAVSPKTDAVDYYGPNRIIHFTPLEKKHSFLLKVIYGDSFQMSDKWQFINTDTFLHKQTAEITYKVSSAKAQGYLDAEFTIEKDRSIILQKVSFLPFDYSQNAFINNLCENELSLIKTQQISSLIDTIALYADADKMKNLKGVSKRLETIKISSNTLFTSRLMMEGGYLWVVGIYDTDKADERLMLGYKLVGKKFKPALVEIIKKGG